MVPLLLASATAACGGTEGPEGPNGPAGRPEASAPVLLVEHSAWVPAEPDEDAFPDHRPELVRCDPSGLFENVGVLVAETDVCNYVSVVQPLEEALPAGATIRLPMWHLQLFAPEPAEGHLAFLVGEELLLEYVVPIPSPAYIETRDLVVTRAQPAGTKVQLHLHNHGQNHWRIGPVERVR